jgi:hypothetical protein
MVISAIPGLSASALVTAGGAAPSLASSVDRRPAILHFFTFRFSLRVFNRICRSDAGIPVKFGHLSNPLSA